MDGRAVFSDPALDMAMTDETALPPPPSYMGIPTKVATPEQMRFAILCGQYIGGNDDWSFYRYDGNMYVMPRTATAVGEHAFQKQETK